MGGERGGAKPVGDAIQLNVVGGGVHQAHNAAVSSSPREPKLQGIVQLLRVTDPDHEAIKVTCHCAPRQREVIWAYVRHLYRAQLRISL